MNVQRRIRTIPTQRIATMSDILFVCPYCGDEYGDRLGCCGESRGHGIYVIDGMEETQYETLAEAQRALAEEGDENGDEQGR